MPDSFCFGFLKSSCESNYDYDSNRKRKRKRALSLSVEVKCDYKESQYTCCIKDCRLNF